MTLREATQQLKESLQILYDAGEAESIARLAVEYVTGFNRNDLTSNEIYALTAVQKDRLQEISAELKTHKPIQYVLGEAWFMGMKFFVDENVLIPRPETEELVDVVVKSLENKNRTTNENINRKKNLTLLDVGTGSGCIAIALKKILSEVEVHSIDISESALAVAKNNALDNGVEINFQLVNILDEAGWALLPFADVIVSNPPYMPVSEKSTMHNNVVNFEPHTALFVPDDDPLVFYKAIVRFAEFQKKSCKVFFEIHENAADALRKFFKGYDLELRRDLQGKERMLVIKIAPA